MANTLITPGKTRPPTSPVQPEPAPELKSFDSVLDELPASSDEQVPEFGLDELTPSEHTFEEAPAAETAEPASPSHAAPAEEESLPDLFDDNPDLLDGLPETLEPISDVSEAVGESAAELSPLDDVFEETAAPLLDEEAALPHLPEPLDEAPEPIAWR